MDTFLPPIEEPRRLIMKLVYAMTRRQFGKVETALLIREHVARLNVCLFCMDIGRWVAAKASLSEKKFEALEQYRTSPLFTEAERAALDYVTELTKDKHINPETFARMARYYSERQICEIVWLVASEHVYNLTNIGLNIHSDMLCAINQ
jgi:alkylhydroperoxidase family enzyme